MRSTFFLSLDSLLGDVIEYVHTTAPFTWNIERDDWWAGAAIAANQQWIEIQWCINCIILNSARESRSCWKIADWSRQPKASLRWKWLSIFKKEEK